MPGIESATENADLFWGLRGGGGNFRRRHHRSSTSSIRSARSSPSWCCTRSIRQKQALTLYRDFAMSILDEVNTIGGLLTSPEA